MVMIPVVTQFCAFAHPFRVSCVYLSFGQVNSQLQLACDLHTLVDGRSVILGFQRSSQGDIVHAP